MQERLLKLPKELKESFFLWGPRQAGKSTLLKATYPGAKYLDFLKNEECIKYLERPQQLREELIALNKKEITNPVVIDEVQKVPAILDEIHWLIENLRVKFALCGSSARKLKRGKANLLGGRAVRYEMYGLSAYELQKDFNLTTMLNKGYLPRHYLSTNTKQLVDSYVEDYLKEEIADEGLSRNLPAFSSFLYSAALSDTEIVNFSNIARDCGVSSPTVKEHFQILVDTLIAKFLPAYIRRPKRRVIQAPKFYFFDVGIVNYLTKRNNIEPKSELFGKAFENWVFHELNVYNSYNEKYYDFSYWKLASGIEVDFIVNDMQYAIEAKASEKITDNHLKGLRELIKDHKSIKKRIVISLEKEKRLTSDKIYIYPYQKFISELWSGILLD